MIRGSKILLTIWTLFVFVLGGGLGVLYQKQQASPQLKKTTAVMDTLSSKTILSIIAYGQVTKIEGKDISLFYNGDIIKVSMEENSPVYSFVNDATGKQVQKKVELKEIKIGDNLNITIKLLPGGQLQGQSVFILPSIKAQ